MGISISVITINYNNSSGLRHTIESVRSQSHTPLEYIIIDGGSTDGSIQAIKENSDFIGWWVSQRDNGVYHAMNKGIAKAAGQYILFLNSGDYFNNHDSLSTLLNEEPAEDIIYGDLLMRQDQHTWRKTHPDTLSFEYFLKDSLPHPASLIKRSLFETLGPYSEHYKIVSDWEFFMNAICKHSASYRHVPQPIVVFNEDGISSNSANDNLINAEKQQILSKQYSAFLSD